MLKMIVAHSHHVHTDLAIADLISQCRAQLNGLTPNAALLFSALQLDYSQLLNGLNDAWPDIPLIGCTTDGELSSPHGFSEDSVSLAIFMSDSIAISAGLGRGLSNDLEGACDMALTDARCGAKGKEPALCLITPESLTISGQRILEQLHPSLGDTPIMGGVSADYWHFEQTYQFFGTEVLQDSLPILLFSGPMLVSYGVASGWQPIGTAGLVTSAEGNRVYEIDNQPTIEYYRRFLGKYAQPTGDRPLAMLDADGDVLSLRAPAGNADADGSVAYFTDVPVGTKVQLTVADRDGIIEGSRASVRMALERFPDGHYPDFGLFFTCSGRKMLLGSRVSEEDTILREELPGLPFTGFYGYGEIGPVDTASAAQFHNETFVSLLMGSADSKPIVTAVRDAAEPPEDNDLSLIDPSVRSDILMARVQRSEAHRLLQEGLKDQTDVLYYHVIKELEESNKIIMDSIRYASRIQRAILPDMAFFNEHFSDYFIHWEPRDVVGGDIYWHRPWGDGHLMVLGDCTGHGIPGAFMTLITNGALDRAVKDIPVGQTNHLMTKMHQVVQSVLKQDRVAGESDDGMELGAIYFDFTNEQMTYTGARFELFIARDGAMNVIKGDKHGIGYRGIPAEQPFSTQTIPLQPGTSYYLTSDGLIDQIGGERQRSFGKRRFKELLLSMQDRPMAEQKAELIQSFATYQGSERRRDDVAVIGFRHR